MCQQRRASESKQDLRTKFQREMPEASGPTTHIVVGLDTTTSAVSGFHGYARLDLSPLGRAGGFARIVGDREEVMTVKGNPEAWSSLMAMRNSSLVPFSRIRSPCHSPIFINSSSAFTAFYEICPHPALALVLIALCRSLHQVPSVDCVQATNASAMWKAR